MTAFVFFGLAAAILAALAAIRASNRRRRARRLMEELQRRHIAGLHGMGSGQFADCVWYLLRRDGCSPRRLGSGQGGLLLARTGYGKTLVHCRYWTSALLGDNQLREIERAMRRNGVSRGMLVTAGRVSDTLGSKATRAGVEVLDGRRLLQRLLGDNHPKS